jgi:hypothetical protein
LRRVKCHLHNSVSERHKPFVIELFLKINGVLSKDDDKTLSFFIHAVIVHAGKSTVKISIAASNVLRSLDPSGRVERRDWMRVRKVLYVAALYRECQAEAPGHHER